MADEEDIIVDAPTDLSVEHYLQARAQELLAMAKAAKTKDGNSQPLQKLPIHMRRRAASHNAKRLPRVQHDWAHREMVKAGAPSVNKRPSRKHRRRPGNLLKEYSRRKRRHVWLETHIWHAKRFHMTEKWGYKIPLHPNDKGARAAYRATAKYCLLQDHSYHCCVEICGPQKDILSGLSQLTSPDTGLLFGAKMYIGGTREGSTVVYQRGQYPYHALGPVQFMWRHELVCDNSETETEPESSSRRQLWIWSHPAMYRDLMKQLRGAFNVKEEDDAEEMNVDDDKESNVSEAPMSGKMKRLLKDRLVLEKLRKKRQQPKSKKNDTCHVVKEQEDVILKKQTFTNGVVTVTSLKDALCRFHLTGPLSNEVLLDTLKLADLMYSSAGQSENTANRSFLDLMRNPYSDIANDLHSKQRDFWQLVKATDSPGELSPHSILGLVVRDPRLFIPKKKALVNFESKDFQPETCCRHLPPGVSWSPIWEEIVREKSKECKMSDSALHSARSESLVPGSELDLGQGENKVPVLLIQNPGRRPTVTDVTDTRGSRSQCCTGYGSGWDVILPGGWGMAFWIALVYRGARAAGIKETQSLALEQGVHCYPGNYPDTPAGREWDVSNWRQLQSKHNRIPPAKRPSFSKVGVSAPFHYPWHELTTEWSENCTADSLTISEERGEFCVLRNKSALKKLQLASLGKVSICDKGEPPQKKHKRTTDKERVVLDATDWPRDSLVAVAISMILRGKPEPHSVICAPRGDDLTQLVKDKCYSGPVEPLHKPLREKGGNHQKLKKEKVMLPQNPPVLADVTKSMSRDVIGYVSEGNFTFSSGNGTGLGFLALPALLELLSREERRNILLIRSPRSHQYRFAKLSVIV